MKLRGEHGPQLQRAQQAYARAVATRHRPLIVQALLVRSVAEIDNDAPAEASLRELAPLAADAHDDRAAALAWLFLSRELVDTRADFEQSKLLDPVIDAAVTRAGSPPDLRYQVHMQRSFRAMTLHEGDLAIQEAEGAKPLAPDELRRLNADGADLKARFTRDGPAAALPLALALLGRYQQLLGPEHPTCAITHEFIAQLGVLTGDFALAEHHAQRAVTIRESVFGREHRSLATPLHVLSWITTMRGNAREAVALSKRSVAILERYQDPATLASVLTGLGTAAFEADGIAAARPPLERALALYEQLHGRDSIPYARAENELASKLVDADDCTAAEPLLAHAVGVLETRQRPAMAAMPILLRGRCLRARGAVPEALAQFERAVELCAQHTCEPAIGLNATRDLGEALLEARRDRTRGAALLRAARAGFAEPGMQDYVDYADTLMKKYRIPLR